MKVLPMNKKISNKRAKSLALVLVALVMSIVLVAMVACTTVYTAVDIWNTYASNVKSAKTIKARAVVTDKGVEVYVLDRSVEKEGEGATVTQSITKLGDNFLPSTTTTTNQIEKVDQKSLWAFDLNNVASKLSEGEGELTVSLTDSELSRSLFVDGSLGIDGNATAVVKGEQGCMTEAIFTFTLSSGRIATVTYTYSY